MHLIINEGIFCSNEWIKLMLFWSSTGWCERVAIDRSSLPILNTLHLAISILASLINTIYTFHMECPSLLRRPPLILFMIKSQMPIRPLQTHPVALDLPLRSYLYIMRQHLPHQTRTCYHHHCSQDNLDYMP